MASALRLLHLLLHLLRGPRVPSVLLLLLHLHLGLLVSAGELEMMEQDAPGLTCSEGLLDCHVKSVSPFSAAVPDPNDTVDVTHTQLKVMLCCSDAQDCEPCLRIIITVKAAEQVSEESGEHGDEEESFSHSKSEGSGENVLLQPTALVKVGLSSPGHSEIWKMLEFKLSLSSSPQSTHELLLTEPVRFDSPVVVQVYAHSQGTHNVQHIKIPSLEEVCSMNLEAHVKDCDAPRLRAETEPRTNVLLLHLENADARREDLMYQMIWNERPGEIRAWPKGEREMVVPSYFVTPCLCFQVWWKGKTLRREFCPFKNQNDTLERMQHNVSVSLEEFPVRAGGTGVSWNVTAPCRLEAEVWLCKREPAGGRCEEVTGSRQRLHNHADAGWRATRYGHWKAGEFNVSSHPLLCVQIKIHGMETLLEPQCPFATSRWKWSLPLLIGLLLICLAILGAYFIQGVLKGYVWRWLKDDDVKGAVGGGHVVLLYPPDGNQALPGLMCHLGSSLQALGFSVSLDLWNQAELSVLGPVPWLHSRLDRLKRQGGKVVLVLTQAARIKAEEWGAQSWERNRFGEEEEAGRSNPASFPCVDVFSASFSCILADYLQGRAGERFMLVQFESLPPETQGVAWPLPELFRGLHVYSLPSQSLGFLTELAGARQMATASARRKRAGGLRVASRALARGLSGFTSGTAILRFAGMSQSCVGLGESGEMVPLQPSLITPPSSPDTSPSRVKWNGSESKTGRPRMSSQ
ncbi:LOW QUALITY PROTEIN: interleukin-17 receptor C [Limanda limanda]|uniref:LOW QUALITY PROTEIN: interleukin-17 receptor C n=1 Tax=Limanda limanda TaxID=27771 RepID=UPI0029C73DC2|nr:LOW QUALITY PROTEIN: interleukin-17 receptor C [Limanda limanda]